MGKTKEIRGFKRGIISLLFLLGMVLSLGGRANAAETIASGQIVTGEIDNGSKTFEFIAPENGTVDIEATIYYDSSSVNKYGVQIYDSSNMYLNEETYNSGKRKRNYNSFFGSQKNEKATIVISYEGKCEYSIICNFDTRDDYEQEGNNFVESANVLEHQKTIYGNLFDVNDEDYYEFSVDKNSEMILNFGPEHTESFYQTWNLDISTKDDDLNPIWTKEIGSSGLKENILLSEGIYIIKVTSGSNYTSRSYRLSVNSNPSVVKPPKIKAKGKTGEIALSWSQNKDTEGYEVECCHWKNFSKPNRYIVWETQKKISNLRSGNTYYVRVRAFRSTVTGEKVYSQYSKTKKVKIK